MRVAGNCRVATVDIIKFVEIAPQLKSVKCISVFVEAWKQWIAGQRKKRMQKDNGSLYTVWATIVL